MPVEILKLLRFLCPPTIEISNDIRNASQMRASGLNSISHRRAAFPSENYLEWKILFSSSYLESISIKFGWVHSNAKIRRQILKWRWFQRSQKFRQTIWYTRRCRLKANKSAPSHSTNTRCGIFDFVLFILASPAAGYRTWNIMEIGKSLLFVYRGTWCSLMDGDWLPNRAAHKPDKWPVISISAFHRPHSYRANSPIAASGPCGWGEISK